MPPSWPRRCHLFLGLLSLHPGKVLVVDVLRHRELDVEFGGSGHQVTRSPRRLPLVHPPYLSRSWQHSILHNFVWDGLVELGEHFLELFVSKALPKVLDEDVADTAPPEGGVTLAPHDPSLGTPRRCAQPRQSWGLSCRGSLDVINNVNCDHWRSLDDGDCLENLLLVVLGVRAVHLVSSHIIKHEQHKQTHMNTNYEHNINIIWTLYKHKQNLGC